MYRITVPGEPKTKARARWAKFGMYNPKESVDYENRIRLFFTEQNKDAVPIDGPVALTILAYFSIPKSKSKKAKADMARHIISPAKKPDIDNIIKSFADSLNGLAYKDDSQVCFVLCKKLYDERPRCVCVIEEYKEIL